MARLELRVIEVLGSIPLVAILQPRAPGHARLRSYVYIPVSRVIVCTGGVVVHSGTDEHRKAMVQLGYTPEVERDNVLHSGGCSKVKIVSRQSTTLKVKLPMVLTMSNLDPDRSEYAGGGHASVRSRSMWALRESATESYHVRSPTAQRQYGITWKYLCN
jgi:hypothetical protein